MSERSVNARELRRALGSFATGVTVVTTRDAAGEPTGVTVNSFNSVSLSPPLVLWSLGNAAASFDIFTQATHFLVNVLAADQVELAERFAKTGRGKFEGLNFSFTSEGLPLLDAVAASFICRSVFRYPGGDHVILVGEVIAFADSGRPALAYARGRYADITEREQQPRDEQRSIRVVK